MGGAVRRELPSVPFPAEALHTRASGPSAMRLPMTLSAVPPGCGHSAFFLGGGKSILEAANCGSEASCPSVAMMEMRSPWIFVFLLEEPKKSPIVRKVPQPARTLTAKMRTREQARRDFISALSPGFELRQYWALVAACRWCRLAGWLLDILRCRLRVGAESPEPHCLATVSGIAPA